MLPFGTIEPRAGETHVARDTGVGRDRPPTGQGVARMIRGAISVLPMSALTSPLADRRLESTESVLRDWLFSDCGLICGSAAMVVRRWNLSWDAACSGRTAVKGLCVQ